MYTAEKGRKRERESESINLGALKRWMGEATPSQVNNAVYDVMYKLFTLCALYPDGNEKLRVSIENKKTAVLLYSLYP